MIEPNEIQGVEAVAAHYDELDQFYRELWGDHVHHGLWISGRESSREAVEKLVRYIAHRADISAGDRVCDVGCGYGATARLLTSEYQADVLGLTVSKSQYDFARARTNGQASPRYLLRDWEQNGLTSSSFDAVVSIECLAHVRDKARYFGEIQRVLRPGRKAVIAAWLAKDKPTSWQVMRLLEPICREGRLAGLGSAEEYKQLIHQANLRLVEFRPLTHRVRKTWVICVRRVILAALTRPEYRRFLIDQPTPNCVFAITIGRILLAMYRNVMQYGIFVVQKDE